jgi:formyl-CoA transferase
MTNNRPDNVKGPLEGIRVVDWTMWQLGPVSTMMLADMGAEVIKVESLNGDHSRGAGRLSSVGSDALHLEASSYYFECLNRQKQGIALNLKHPRGIQVMRRLVEESDVFVQNFRQGVAERLGLGYDDLRRSNPGSFTRRPRGTDPRDRTRPSPASR